jgi:hypothetical protein
MTRAKTTLKIVQPDLDQLEAVVKEAATLTAPMVQRYASHMDRLSLERRDLERERSDLIERRDLLRRQVEAAEQGIAMHLEDIAATLALYPQQAV